MSVRDREIVVILGASGVGKTTVSRHLVNRYLAGGGDVRILDPSRDFGELGEWPGRGGLKQWILDLTANGEGPAGGGWGPGLLVLNDADRFLAPTPTMEWLDVWVANRHLGLDLVVNAHRPSRLPKDLLGSANELWLFRQQETRAVEYLASVEALAPLFENRDSNLLPTEKYRAVRVRVHEQVLELVNIKPAP